jgi:hypothetical protein
VAEAGLDSLPKIGYLRARTPDGRDDTCERPWMRRRQRDLVVLSLAVSVGLSVAVAGPRFVMGLVHQRDPGAFHAYVDNWSRSLDPEGSKRDKRWIARNPDSVLAQGDLACAWLERQPPAPIVDASGSFSVDTLMRRYLESADTEVITDLSDLGRRTVVAGAWTHLCWGTRADKTAPTGFEDD